MKIVFIGPMGIGKTSVSKRAADKFNLKYYDFDELRWEMFKQMEGFDKEKERYIAENEPPEILFDYWKQFEAEQVKLLVENNLDGVFDLGAGHSVQKDSVLFKKVQNALKTSDFVVYLKYSEDTDKSVKSLSNRNEIPEEMQEFYNNMNREFIDSDCNDRLSNITIYCEGKNEQQIFEEVIERLVK